MCVCSYVCYRTVTHIHICLQVKEAKKAVVDAGYKRYDVKTLKLAPVKSALLKVEGVVRAADRYVWGMMKGCLLCCCRATVLLLYCHDPNQFCGPNSEAHVALHHGTMRVDPRDGISINATARVCPSYLLH